MTEPPSIPTVSRSVVPWSPRTPRGIVSLFPGIRKKRTYVYSVRARKRTTAQASRLSTKPSTFGRA
jgi:hypothetical protein